jgi:5-methylcytosine-specific restriction endonuclease McrA
VVYTGEKKREYDRKWAKDHRNRAKEYWKNIRLKVIQKLGGKCIYCGCDNLEALEINHINGGGCKEMRKGVTKNHNQRSFYLAILRDERKDVELTCRVCNSVHYLVKLKGLPNNWKVTYCNEGMPKNLTG